MLKVKGVLVGDAKVGKSCLLITYITKAFPKDYIPSEFDYFKPYIKVDNKHVTFDFWDTSSQDNNKRILSYPNTNVFLICFSVSDRASFLSVQHKWTKELTTHDANCPIMLVGTKIDLRNDKNTNCVSRDEGIKMVEEIGAKGYMECSALTQHNIKEMFEEAVRIALKYGMPQNNRQNKNKCQIL